MAEKRLGGYLSQQTLQFIERISSIPLLVLLTMLSLLFPLVLFPAHGTGDIRLLDLHFSYSPEQVHEHLIVLGMEGRAAYKCMALTSDLAFPIVYSFTFSVAIMLVLRELLSPASRLRYLSLLPFLIVIIDWCENLSLAWVTDIFPERANEIVNFASYCTSMKWSLVALMVLLLFVTVAIWAVNGIRGK